MEQKAKNEKDKWWAHNGEKQTHSHILINECENVSYKITQIFTFPMASNFIIDC